MRNQFKMFTGGVLDTNCFYYPARDGFILFDAPQGSAEAFAAQPIDLLVLTHGHFDHIADAAALIRDHGCQVVFHPDTTPMATDREFFRRWGFGLEFDPFQADRLIADEGPTSLLGTDFDVLHVPGHCPGSLCFHQKDEKTLVGGDVLFAGGVGRWDLPGGDRDLLFNGIRTKLFALPDDVTVLPGHGPATTIGEERRSNPFLQD